MRPTSSTSTSATSPSRRSPPRVAVRAAQHKLPVGLVAALDVQLRSQAAGDRLDEVIDEVGRVREEVGLAAARGADRPDRRVAGAPERPHGEPLLDDGRRAARPRERALRPHARARSIRRSPAPSRTSAASPSRRSTSTRCARMPTGLPRARRSCCCSRSSARRQSRCCARSASARAATSRSPPAASTSARQERIREVVRIVQETGVGEITIEEDGMRVSVRRTAEPHVPAGSACCGHGRHAASRSRRSRATTRSCASRARWSAPSTARLRPEPRPFVEVGDPVAAGETLCILEAMKLMNEVKSEVEGDRPQDPRRKRRARRVRPAAVRARADQRPTARRCLVLAPDVQARPGREPWRDRRPGDPRAARARRRGGGDLLDRRPGLAARAAGRPGDLRRAARGDRELPAHPERDRRRGDDRLRGGASRATASSPRIRRSSRHASTTTSSSSARPRT